MKTTPSFKAWIVVCLALTLATCQATVAAPVTGSVTISGTVQLDNTNLNFATVVLEWTNTVAGATGAFASAANKPVVFSPNAWSFNSGPVTNLWSVGGLTYDLVSSTVQADGGGFLNVTLNGSIYGNGFARTACMGSFSAYFPYLGSSCYFSALSLSAVPAPPPLSIVRAGSNIKVCWPTNTYNYILLQSSSNTGTNWVATSYAITNGFGTNFCTIPCMTNSFFFKLSQ